MHLLVSALLFYPVGRLYLFIRYRDEAQRTQVLEQEHLGEYADVGRVILFKGIGVFFVSLIALMLAVAIFRAIFPPEF